MEHQENITEKESLKIITEMINQAKVNINQSSFHLLMWGWIIFIASLLNFTLLKLSYFEKAHYAWLLVIPGVIASFIYGWREGSRQRVSTYADRMYMWIWIGFFFTFGITFFLYSDLQGRINSIVLLMAGYATFLSGHTLKFKPLITGGILFWLFAIIAYLFGNEYSLLVTSVSVLTGYLIPGYLLKNKVKDVTF